jgi:hypothetical protein
MNNSTSLRGLERKPQVHLFEIFMFQFLERFYFGPGSIIIDYRSKRTTENSSILMRKTELKSQDIKHDKKRRGTNNKQGDNYETARRNIHII